MISIPNILTISRIFGVFLLLLSTPFSIPFYILYVYCGITDILDGYTASKFNCASKSGAFLDTCADLFFTAVIVVKLIPTLAVLLNRNLVVWVIIIAIIRIISLVIGLIKFHTICFLHTYLNKLTGLSLFVGMLFLNNALSFISICIMCTLATIAALEELIILIKNNYLNRDIKSILIKSGGLHGNGK